MTIKEDSPDIDAPLRAPNEREPHDNTLLVSLNPTNYQTILSPGAFRQVVPRKKALISFMVSLVVLSAHSTAAIPARGNTSSEESNASPSSILRLTTSIKERIGNPFWNQLSSQLSEDAFQVSKPDDWLTQCIHPFADFNFTDATTLTVSNYQLLEQPSGMCMCHAVCAYKECIMPFPYSRPGAETYDSAIYTDESLKNAEGLDLPDAIVHPIHVGDISEAIKFAAANKIEVSVKTTGHSYTGASMKAGSILLNLSKLKKYSPNGSIVECGTSGVLEGASEQSCKLALARDKTAFVRVGGGEIWDEPLQAVSFVWNNDENNALKYHMVTGSAGTVSAAGGWLASGGLSGNNDMRTYGVGIDQVLHVEMVLPSGVHVRFGPTDWKIDTSMLYPRTTTVTGYCNKGDLQDEDDWAWEECKENINFDDLWFAVRGGGGGAYGVITSIYYQLHKYSPMEVVNVEKEGLRKGSDKLKKLWIEFVLTFFFDPTSINVTESASHHCSSEQSGGFKGGNFYCFDGAGDVMKAAWAKFNPLASDLVSVNKSDESWAAHQVNRDDGHFKGNTGVPKGRINDEGPSPTMRNTFYGTGQFLMFPEDILIKKRDKMVMMIFNCLSDNSTYDEYKNMYHNSCFSGGVYIMGGKIPSAHDGMNSFPLHRRHGAFLMVIIDPAVRTKFSRFFNDISEGEVWTGDSFPGSLCHNHASLDYPTPLKEDWALTCDPDWTKGQREEKCLSYQETAWGTDILAKLEKIHSSVDPDRLFRPDDGVGYAPAGKKDSKASKRGGKKDKSKTTKGDNKVNKTKSAKDSNRD